MALNIQTMKYEMYEQGVMRDVVQALTASVRELLRSWGF